MKTTTRRGANHGLHLVLTLLTCGLWAVTGWPVAAAMGRRTTVHHQTPRYSFPPENPYQQPYTPPPVDPTVYRPPAQRVMTPPSFPRVGGDWQARYPAPPEQQTYGTWPPQEWRTQR